MKRCTELKGRRKTFCADGVITYVENPKKSSKKKKKPKKPKKKKPKKQNPARYSEFNKVKGYKANVKNQLFLCPSS